MSAARTVGYRRIPLGVTGKTTVRTLNPSPPSLGGGGQTLFAVANNVKINNATIDRRIDAAQKRDGTDAGVCRKAPASVPAISDIRKRKRTSGLRSAIVSLSPPTLLELDSPAAARPAGFFLCMRIFSRLHAVFPVPSFPILHFPPAWPGSVRSPCRQAGRRNYPATGYLTAPPAVARKTRRRSWA